MSTSSDLTFTAEGHVYRDLDGNVIPSVTQILKETRISADFVTMREFSARRATQIDTKADIGTAVHADAHAYDDGDLDWDTVHEQVKPYVEAWARFRTDKQVEPLLRERFVWHQALGYCGTLDGVFKTPGGLVLADLKCGDPESAGAQFQTAAYELALRQEHVLPPMERWSVQLVPDAAVPYRITPYHDHRADEARWRAIVTTFYLQHVRRPR